VNIYEAFLARGSNVELPVNTPVLLRVDENAGRPGAIDATAVTSENIQKH
jgi:hypothetical protein